MESKTIFTNDDNVEILLPQHHFSTIFAKRDNHEVLFRRINTYLIKNGLIKNNIIDLGCWIGDNSVPWAKNIDGNIYAIDPSPNNCIFVKMLAHLNSLKNINVIQKAISEMNKIVSTNGHIDHCSFVGTNNNNGHTKINSYSLDYLHETGEIKNIGYIHLDVEGMEFNVIKGSLIIIEKYRPIVSFEQHLNIDDYNALCKYFQNEKYDVYLVDEILPGCRPDCRNFMAFPKELNIKSKIDDIHKFVGKNCLKYC